MRLMNTTDLGLRWPQAEEEDNPQQLTCCSFSGMMSWQGSHRHELTPVSLGMNVRIADAWQDSKLVKIFFGQEITDLSQLSGGMSFDPSSVKLICFPGLVRSQVSNTPLELVITRR